MSILRYLLKPLSDFSRFEVVHLKSGLTTSFHHTSSCKSTFCVKHFKRITHVFSSTIFTCLSLIGTSIYVLNKNLISCEDDIVNSDCHFDNSRTLDVKFHNAISKSRDLLQRIKDEVGAPGIVIGVSVDGKSVWEEGIGYSDIENRVPCTENTIMRIASISKSLTMTAVAKLWEDGKLDLDKPVQEYVPDFPMKTFNGQPVTLTCRHLVSHLGGIRHYDKSILNSKNDSGKEEETKEKNNEVKLPVNNKIDGNKDKVSEFQMKEYFIKDRYQDVKSSLELFENDPLVSKPGSKYLYSTHGWTLVSAIIEGISKEKFPIYMSNMFKKLNMNNTYLDVHGFVIYHRSRNYLKDKKGHIINAPYVDNSYKWAGGGFLSTVGDLLKFGNMMLYSLQYRSTYSQPPVNNKFKNDNHITKTKQEIFTVEESNSDITREKHYDIKQEYKEENCKRTLPGYLKRETVKTVWSPIVNVKNNVYYGMGWGVAPEEQQCEFCELKRFYVTHSGGAIGASSVLFILPKKCDSGKSVDCSWVCPPKGIIVAIFANLQDVYLESTALKIAKIFDNHS